MQYEITFSLVKEMKTHENYQTDYPVINRAAGAVFDIGIRRHMGGWTGC
jgi:hypothetical protein